ncbi:glutathione S-transferase N-terminal domain-containing protein [Massilia jejuensis]|uniref:Glutathione S-transferase N-terminal domain-containing protein n=1 Tax=Massilia jejuensis TaxID=648894 RepID=A0ABW0PSY8_9BURK
MHSGSLTAAARLHRQRQHRHRRHTQASRSGYVRIALSEKGATDKIQFVHVDVMKGEHRLPAFVSKNPSASVPVLELDDGTFISECSAITEHIDHAFDGISLTGTTAKERAVIHMM